MRKIDYHFEKQAISGLYDECGDTGVIKVYDHFCFLGLVDALGHGKNAFDIASLAGEYLLQHHTRELTALIQGLHGALKGTRGAVAAVGRLDIDTGIFQYSGMGNINLRIFGNKPGPLMTKDGILGYMISSPVQGETRLMAGDTLVVSSDGIKEHFDAHTYPDLLMGQAKDICTGFMKHLGKQNDDRSCMVLRYGI